MKSAQGLVVLSSLIFAQAVLGQVGPPAQRHLFGSMAYRAVATERMLEEANYFCRQLHLPISQPIQVTNIVSLIIRSPRDGFGGTFVAKGFGFSFPNPGEGKLCYVSRDEIRSRILAMYPVLAKTPSLIDTNGAYQLATQWLSAISVDVPALERKHKLIFRQWFFWGKPEDLPKANGWQLTSVTTNKTLLPIFDVKWGDADNPAVKVTILGSTKELMELRMEDSSFSRRPPLVITNALELENIPDPPIKHLQQRPAQESPTNSVGQTNAPSQQPPPFRRKAGTE